MIYAAARYETQFKSRWIYDGTADIQPSQNLDHDNGIDTFRCVGGIICGVFYH